MQIVTKFLLDSGDPEEYKEIQALAKDHGASIWGATTNPSLIAKKLAGKKISQDEAFRLQKGIVLEILTLVPGPVSAEVYADEKTTASEMIQQGKEIASWHDRVVVKLPTTLEGFRARTELRKESICINNTLVFSQQQIFAICLHEAISQKEFGPTQDLQPPFISPFIGRLDDIGEDGISLVENGMKIKKLFSLKLPQSPLAIWMLASSLRSMRHMETMIEDQVELITAPGKVYKAYFYKQHEEEEKSLTPLSYWSPPQNLLSIESFENFFEVIEKGELDITHPLTDKGIARFRDDWQAIIG